jgi:hypothetical protein
MTNDYFHNAYKAEHGLLIDGDVCPVPAASEQKKESNDENIEQQVGNALGTQKAPSKSVSTSMKPTGQRHCPLP